MTLKVIAVKVIAASWNLSNSNTLGNIALLALYINYNIFTHELENVSSTSD